MPSTQQMFKFARLFHLYSGVFLAPALLFFAVTGGLQTFSLHETTRGRAYTPPAILVELGQLHKKQTLVVPVRRPPQGEGRPGERPGEGKPGTKQQPAPPSESAPGPARGASPAQTPAPGLIPAPVPKVHNLLPMKIFFVVVALGLFFSTLTGLWMSYRFAHRKRNVTLALVAGVIVPLLLLLLF